MRTSSGASPCSKSGGAPFMVLRRDTDPALSPLVGEPFSVFPAAFVLASAFVIIVPSSFLPRISCATVAAALVRASGRRR